MNGCTDDCASGEIISYSGTRCLAECDLGIPNSDSTQCVQVVCAEGEFISFDFKMCHETCPIFNEAKTACVERCPDNGFFDL